MNRMRLGRRGQAPCKGGGTAAEAQKVKKQTILKAPCEKIFTAAEH